MNKKVVIKNVRKFTIFVCLMLFASFTLGALASPYLAKAFTTNNEEVVEPEVVDEITGDIPEEEIIEKNEELPFTTKELQHLTALVYAEARGCSDIHQQYVCNVVLNRVKSERFPSSIDEVISAPRQYSTKDKALSDEYFLRIFSENPKELLRCQENVIKTFLFGTDMPDNVVYQSNFPDLGSGNWKTIEQKTDWFCSITYFNYI